MKRVERKRNVRRTRRSRCCRNRGAASINQSRGATRRCARRERPERRRRLERCRRPMHALRTRRCDEKRRAEMLVRCAAVRSGAVKCAAAAVTRLAGRAERLEARVRFERSARRDETRREDKRETHAVMGWNAMRWVGGGGGGGAERSEAIDCDAMRMREESRTQVISGNANARGSSV